MAVPTTSLDFLTPVATSLAAPYLGVQEGDGSLPAMCINGTNCDDDAVTFPEATRHFESVVRVVVPSIFALIGISGFAGNLLVIIVVFSNEHMRNTTNLLIINLAIADLFFIITCVPFTATTYALPFWLFGSEWCKIYQFMIHVTAYASVYTLVLMSLDRYLAVVHPLRSMTIRTERNAYIVIIVSWIVICVLNCPILIQCDVVTYIFNGEVRSACLNANIFKDPEEGKIHYGCFFVFAYVLPLALVTFLYGFMLRRLLYGVVPGCNQSAESMRQKRRVTRMVIIVVVLFAVCWLPIQTVFMLTNFGSYPNTLDFIAVQIASNCFAYMNSCLNPFLYAFLSDNFRKSFRKLLCCQSKFQAVTLEFDRTTTAGRDAITRSTGMNSKENCV